MMEEDANPLPPGGIHSSTARQQQEAGGTVSETATMVIDSAGNFDVVASHVVNDVIATTTTQPKNAPVLQFELQMSEEDANPLPPGTDSSAHQQAGGTMSETTTMVMDSAGNSDVVASHVVNDVISTTTTQPENTPVLQFELPIPEEDANPLPPGTDSSAHQQGGGTISETTTMVVDSAGNSDVVASHVVKDLIATTTTQSKNTPALQSELQMLEEDANTLSPGTYSFAHQQDGGTMGDTTSTVMHSAGDSDVAASHVVNDVIAETTTTTTQPKNTPFFQCEICNINCDTQVVLETHKLGKKHSKTLQKLAKASAIDKSLADTKGLKNATSECGSSSSLGTKSATFQCEVCKISCTSNELLNLHLSGKKHLRKLKQLEEIPDPSLTPVASLDQPESTEGKTVELHQGEPLSCYLCGIACNSYDMLKAHNSGKKHQKNVENSLKPIGPNPAPGMEAESTAPMMIGPLQDGGKMVKADGSNGKAKRTRGHEDVGRKKQKLSQGGASNALSRCTLCSVVCTSPHELISHFAGKKHHKLALKQAEAQFD